MIERFKEWLITLKNIQTLLNYSQEQVIKNNRRLTNVELEQRIQRDKLKDFVEFHTDVHMRGPSIIVAIGKYHGNDYVRIFDMEDETFDRLVGYLRDLDRHHGSIGRIDAPPNFTSALRESVFRWS